MIDQLTIGDKASYDDFGASLARFDAKPPKKKSIRETIPFFNGSYDFSAINGEVYWEDRVIECIFEMLADTPEELEEKKAAFSNWVMNVTEQHIHSPFIPDYHFVGTFDEMDYEDDDGLDKTTATVTFLAYPYKVANVPKKYEYHTEWQDINTWYIPNESSHPVEAYVTITSARAGNTVQIDDTIKTTTEEPVDTFYLKIPPDTVRVQVSGKYGSTTVMIEFTEEAL